MKVLVRKRSGRNTKPTVREGEVMYKSSSHHNRQSVMEGGEETNNRSELMVSILTMKAPVQQDESQVQVQDPGQQAGSEGGNSQVGVCTEG